MKISEIIKEIDGKVLSCADDIIRRVGGAFVCDLLSLAMSRINPSDIWITIQTNANIIAVASLTDASCIIIPEGLNVGEDVISLAQEKDIMLISTKLSAFMVCKKIGEFS